MNTAKDLFREMSKQVHPDLNGGGDKFNNMMKEVLQNRNDGNALLDLARKWGLNLDGSFDTGNFNRKAESFHRDVFEAMVGAVVRWSFKYKFKNTVVRGVITKVRRINKGRYKGAKEYSIYDFKRGNIWKTKAFGEPRFDVVGMADDQDLDHALDRESEIKANKKLIDKSNQAYADAQFEAIGIRTSTRYNDGTQVQVRYKSGPKWEYLIRTTKRCVYIEDPWGKNRERLIKIHAIIGVR